MAVHSVAPRRPSPVTRRVSSRGIEIAHKGLPAFFELDDDIPIPRMLLEAGPGPGPGPGKSTITQMAAQVYREKLLGTSTCAQRDATWLQQCKLRIPIRLELRHFSEWLSDTPHGTLDQYVALQLGRDSGGSSVSSENVHQLVERSSIILFLDGLDEVGNDPLRDRVLDAAVETIDRFERGLKSDLRVVLTTRPPAVFGRWNKLDGFTRVGLLPLSHTRINDYVDRWLNTQIATQDEQARIRNSFNGRRQEPHVEALARNPMQLSVLLQFIQLKDEAFPDRRADLYDEYFKKVIDRDVLKSPSLREHRELIEGLHSFLGFRLHGSTEAAQGRRSLTFAGHRPVFLDVLPFPRVHPRELAHVARRQALCPHSAARWSCSSCSMLAWRRSKRSSISSKRWSIRPKRSSTASSRPLMPRTSALSSAWPATTVVRLVSICWTSLSIPPTRRLCSPSATPMMLPMIVAEIVQIAIQFPGDRRLGVSRCSTCRSSSVISSPSSYADSSARAFAGRPTIQTATPVSARVHPRVREAVLRRSSLVGAAAGSSPRARGPLMSR